MAPSDVVTFEVHGRLRDAWGNDHGKVVGPDDEEFTDEGAGPGEDANDDGVLSLDEMNGQQLKEELLRRRNEGREIDTAGVRTVGGLRDVLKADNAAHAAEESGGAHADKSGE